MISFTPLLLNHPLPSYLFQWPMVEFKKILPIQKRGF